MSGDQMIDSFKQYYDKITNLAAPGYTDTEIILFLNNAQDEFIQDRVFGKENQSLVNDRIQRRATDLRPITTKGTLDATTDPLPVIDREFWFLLTGLASYQYILSAQISITRTAYPKITSTEIVRCDIVDGKQWQNFSGYNYMNKMVLHKIPLIVEEGTIKVIVDTYTTIVNNGLYVSYTKIPTPIAASTAIPDLASHTHQEIVDIAVRQALATSQDTRYQSQLAEQQIKKS